MRRYDEAVDVRGEVGEPFSPRQFLWHGRLYVVRDVLSHWYERSSWWDGAAGRAVHGETGDGCAVANALDVGEREVWRVEASAGRSAASGVYDLCASVPGGGGAPSWRLVQVAD